MMMTTTKCFNIVAKKVLNHSINELIEAEILLKTSDDAEKKLSNQCM